MKPFGSLFPFVAIAALSASASFSMGDEIFATISRIEGNRITVVQSGVGGQGESGPARGSGFGRRGKGRGGRGRGRFGAASQTQKILVIPQSTKITSASRERRTFEFRVGAEISGGFKNAIFRDLKLPLQARIVAQGNRVTEINVMIPQTDINQSNADASGGRVIAVRPKRPPAKKKTGK